MQIIKKGKINLNIRTLFDGICRDRKKKSQRLDSQIYVPPNFVALFDNRRDY